MANIPACHAGDPGLIPNSGIMHCFLSFKKPMSTSLQVTPSFSIGVVLGEVYFEGPHHAIRGSHTTSESAFILREWARGEARLVVWGWGRFILGDSLFSSSGEEEFSILHSPRMKM